MPWFEILLIGLGILLLFIEIVLLPGFGAAGVPGIILILVGLGMIWRELGLRMAFAYAGATVSITIPLAILGLWLAPRTKFGRSLILETAEKNTEGFQAPPRELTNLVGKSGWSITPLRPAGVALINGQRVDVVSSGDFIEPETEVEVVYVEGGRVVVRPL
jgi:membrane-bound serine protease (ClpP class)